MQPANRSESSELLAFLSHVRTGNPVRVGEVTLVPLIGQGEPVEAELLEEALRSGHTRVTEVSERGAVNLLTVTHSGALPLLLLDGEQVLGAKQNRVFNASFVIAPGAVVQVPVSCVEAGRWRSESPDFAASQTILSSDARRAKLGRVTQSASRGGGYDADQRAVWRDVSTYLSRTNPHSSTSAFDDGFRMRAALVEQQLASIEVMPGQVGFAAVRGSVVVGMDLFGSTSLFAKGWKKAMRGVLAEVHARAVDGVDPIAVVLCALSDAAEIEAVRQVTAQCGETLHGEGKGLVVGAVVSGGHVYHAVVALTV